MIEKECLCKSFDTSTIDCKNVSVRRRKNHSKSTDIKSEKLRQKDTKLKTKNPSKNKLLTKSMKSTSNYLANNSTLIPNLASSSSLNPPLQIELEYLKSSNSALEFHIQSLMNEKSKQSQINDNNLKTLKQLKSKIKSILHQGQNPFNLSVDGSTETNSNASNISTLAVTPQKSNLNQVTSQALHSKTQSTQTVELQAKANQVESNETLSKYLELEEKRPLSPSQLESKNNEIAKMNERLKLTEQINEKYEKEIKVLKDENKKLAFLVCDLRQEVEKMHDLHEEYKKSSQEYRENVQKYSDNLQKVHEQNLRLKEVVSGLKIELEMKDKVETSKAEDLAEYVFKMVDRKKFGKEKLQRSLCEIWNGNFEVFEVLGK